MVGRYTAAIIEGHGLYRCVVRPFFVALFGSNGDMPKRGEKVGVGKWHIPILPKPTYIQQNARHPAVVVERYRGRR